MVINNEATAHEYARCWIKEGGKRSAIFYINSAMEGQHFIAGSLRSIGHDATNNEAARDVLRSYLDSLRASE